jgi:virginiamycin B lyase
MNRRLGFVGIGALPFLLFLAAPGHPSQTGTGDAPLIAGLGMLSGKVEAPKPFRAARIYARNLASGVRYMVFSARGRYRAVNLFPGDYEVTVEKNGFAVDGKRVTVTPGGSATLDFSLREAQPQAISQAGTMGPARVWDRKDVQLLSYDELYPVGPGRELLKTHCLYCHGLNALPSRPRSEAQWNAAIDVMSDPNSQRGVRIPPGSLTAADRRTIVAYLTTHFGPDTPRRAVRVDAERILDEDGEAAVARAMFVEYPLPLDPTRDASGTVRVTYAPSFDPQGNVWYTDTSRPNRVGRLDPRTATVKDYVLPDPDALPHGLTVDAQGTVWWVENNAFHLGRLDPRTGAIVRYSMDPKREVPRGQGHTPTLDSKQNVWFTAVIGNRIGRWDRRTETITLWAPPTPDSWPYGIVADKGDNIWFAESAKCRVAKFDPRSETFTEYPALTQPCTLARVGLDSKGMIWYGITSAAKLGKLDPTTGKIVEYDIPTPLSEPYDAWPDGEDNIWTTDGGYEGGLIRFDERSGTFAYYPNPSIARVSKIEITREGAVWFPFRTDDRGGVGVLYPDVTRMTTMGAYR